ncbi:MAG TPA: hypothetical protein VGP93_03305, partial [Polyangiaceae bacterium]|nr:hypothetical protein [Polyangiaceae bacterium]
MTDEFPALEVAAALGVLATGIRSYQLLRARQAIPHLAAEIEKALQSGQPARARELCQNTDATALGTVADALLDTLDAGDGRVERALLAS